ncbi:MAG: response regulator [Desulfobacteraceae bacterium]|nr:response regulator [Desulfobacteraceae bacterium]
MTKILVIDDEKPTLSMFRLFLKAYGYDVYIAEDGEKGLEIFDEVKPEIVFTDLKMPGIDGIEVLERIRNSGIKSEVIIITGHGDMEKAVKALDLSASDFINKPVERRALNSALIRVEKRIKQAKIVKFNLSEKLVSDSIEITIKGQLTFLANDSLVTLLDSGKFDKKSKATIIFGDSFSINKEGISSLINFVKNINDKGIPVVMEGLSYNYIRFFEMAGINKIAELVEEEIEE